MAIRPFISDQYISLQFPTRALPSLPSGFCEPCINQHINFREVMATYPAYRFPVFQQQMQSYKPNAKINESSITRSSNKNPVDFIHPPTICAPPTRLPSKMWVFQNPAFDGKTTEKIYFSKKRCAIDMSQGHTTVT
jgi:hypothetical protein